MKSEQFEILPLEIESYVENTSQNSLNLFKKSFEELY